MKRFLFACLAVLVPIAGCGDDSDGPPPVDAGPGDTGTVECFPPGLRWSHAIVGTTPGVDRRVRLSLEKDYECADLTFTLMSSDTGVATVPESVTIPAGLSRVDVIVTGVAPGDAVITAESVGLDEPVTATVDVEVTDATLPACEGTASGNVAPGGRVEVTSGTLTGAAIELQEGASRDDIWHVDPFDVTIDCAPDQVPDGFTALGPAVSFGPAQPPMMREIPFEIPLRLSLLPAGAHRGHVEFTYTGPGVTEPRVIPVAVVSYAGAGDAIVRFEAPRLGTYQAVYRDGVGVARDREFTFHGILGFSMGGSGTGVVGYHNMERFDFVAPLGAAWDWVYMMDYIKTYHLGGFCTEAERQADPTGCEGPSTTDRLPPPAHVHEHIQDFEHWWYEDDRRGQGAIFDRDEYINIFNDLAMMYGNMNTDRTNDPTVPNITPPGVPDEERTRNRTEHCDNPIVIAPFDGSAGTGFFDDEFNPEGTYPVITFCDGRELEIDGDRDVGIWDPAADHDRPVLIVMAVDINGNGLRDQGEPIIRNFHEPYEDCGLDRTCNADEEGYDPVTNPDPAGDDYDYQYNPNGTEGNWLHDGDRCDLTGSEVFTDVGLDGVMGTAQLDAGGFDNGEGNGCFDRTIGGQRMIDRGPRNFVVSATDDDRRDTDVFADGGIRDLFLAGVAANHSFGAWGAIGDPVRYYNGHATLHVDGRTDDETFIFTQVNWEEVGRRILIRYGNPDANEGELVQGDGQHAGRPDQFTNRALSSVAWMNSRWPDGNRERVRIPPGTEAMYKFLLEFESPTTGRTGPASVILPPGYFDPGHEDETYPMVFLLHGYGMEPEDLIVLGDLMWTFMNAPTIPEAERLQKMIFVIPDGFCRGGECVKGTFYTDAPDSSPGAAQMETWMLELMDYMDDNYRVRQPEVFQVID